MKIYLIFFFAWIITMAGISANPSDTAITGDKSRVRIYKFDIKENIAPPVWRTTKIAMEQAHEDEADIILIHMNTYGGMVDAADSIRTKILNSRIPVWVFIDNNAASAG
ncbi:MAG: nodulation protein NfeD, partial [Bacteroidetes bacterium]|nr:nodulation protein NfeD [Bacteroidota bacterium]